MLPGRHFFLNLFESHQGHRVAVAFIASVLVCLHECSSSPAVPPHAQLQVGDTPLGLPDEVLSLIRQLLTEVADGHAVRVVAARPQLSTFEAAELLGVSRPFLISHLLDTGRIACSRVGTHRRIALQDVLAYQEGQQARRAA